MWEVCVEGGEPREGEDLLKLWEPGYYLERYGDKGDLYPQEDSIQHLRLRHGRGRMHEPGRMGWFGLDDATNESTNRYEAKFREYLQEARERKDWRSPL